MKTGYDQFFKNARRAQADEPRPVKAPPKKNAPLPQARLAQQAAPVKAHQAQSSKEMAQELRRRLQPKPTKKKSKIRWKLAATSFLGLGLTLFGLQNLEKMEGLFKKVEISFMGQAYAEDAPKETKDTKKAPVKAGETAVAGNDKQEKPAPTEGKKEFTTEEIDHFSKLNERKKELDARESELTRAETELSVQKAEMEKRLQELEQTRKNISQVLDERVQADDKKVETLVQVYSTMKPQQAAKVFETMDEDLAVEILGRMKKKNAAEIMNLIKAEKAQLFSEKYAGYKRK